VRLATAAAAAALVVLAPACAQRATSPGAGPTQLVWVDREGKPGATLGAVHIDIRDPELSPDGSPLTFAAGATGDELWMIDLAKGAETRLPSGVRLHAQPRGFAAGRPVVSSSTQFHPRLLLVAPDGKFAAGIDEVDGRGRLFVAPIGAGAKLELFTRLLKRNPEPEVVDASLSADGTLLAYEVRGEQRSDVFVTRFPSGDGEWQVSSGGGSAPRFAGAARELFYVARPDSGPSVMSAVEVYASETPPIGLSRAFFDLASIHGLTHPTEYAVTADGRRFLFAERAGTPVP
jgi:Tol biopolymer transport system component